VVHHHPSLNLRRWLRRNGLLFMSPYFQWCALRRLTFTAIRHNRLHRYSFLVRRLSVCLAWASHDFEPTGLG
jgi:hypothetical protein